MAVSTNLFEVFIQIEMVSRGLLTAAGPHHHHAPDTPAVRAVYLDSLTGILAGVKDAASAAAAAEKLSTTTRRKIIMECGIIETRKSWKLRAQ